jgi:ATPase subunit of ABC transporter with duplicated ATPase domains
VQQQTLPERRLHDALVSHDREFLRALSNTVLELGGESGTLFEPCEPSNGAVSYWTALSNANLHRINIAVVATSAAEATRARRESLRPSNRVLELGGESGTEAQPHAYPGSYIDYVERTGHEAPGVHR